MLSVSYLATLLWRKDDEDYFPPNLRVRIKDNSNSPHGKFHRFLFPFPFSSKFSDLNFALHVLYNLPVLCHVSHTVSLGYLWGYLWSGSAEVWKSGSVEVCMKILNQTFEGQPDPKHSKNSKTSI